MNLTQLNSLVSLFGAVASVAAPIVLPAVQTYAASNPLLFGILQLAMVFYTSFTAAPHTVFKSK